MDARQEVQWESWDFDAFDYAADHSAAPAEDDDVPNSITLFNQHEPEPSLRSRPRRNSSFLSNHEDTRHLFAASMFLSSDPYMECDDDWSADSNDTVQAGNGGKGMESEARGRQSESDGAARTAASMTSQGDKANATWADAPAQTVNNRRPALSGSITKRPPREVQPHVRSGDSAKRGPTKTMPLENEETSSKKGIAPPKGSLSDSPYSSRSARAMPHRRSGSWPAVPLPPLEELYAEEGAVVGGGRARAA